MKISKDTQADARRLMRLCTQEDGRLNESHMRQVVATIVVRQPRNYRALLSALHTLVALYEKRHTAVIKSAVSLSSEQQQNIIQRLNSKHQGLSFQWQVDADLIGGISVQIGDMLTDASLRSRIERLSQF